MARDLRCLGDALRAVAGDVVVVTPQRWDFTIVNGLTVSATAVRSGEWLTLEARQLGSLGEADPGWWVRTNARMRGSVRAVQRLADAAPSLRSEWPLEREEDPAEIVTRLYGELRDGLHDSGGVRSVQAAVASAQVPASARRPPTAVVEAVHARLRDAGWPARIGGDDELRMEITTRVGPLAVRLETDSDEEPRLVATLGPMASGHGVCADATARFLLALSASVRMLKVRPNDRTGQTVAEVSVPVRSTSVAAADRAASAIVLAALLAVHELRALTDEHVARCYLEHALDRASALTTSSP